MSDDPIEVDLKQRARELLAAEIAEALRGQVGGRIEEILEDLTNRPLPWHGPALRAIEASLRLTTDTAAAERPEYMGRAGLTVSDEQPIAAQEAAVRDRVADIFERNEMPIMARACRNGSDDPDIMLALDVYSAAAERARGEGMVLVPREPTEAMCVAALHEHYLALQQGLSSATSQNTWRAMLEAALASEQPK